MDIIEPNKFAQQKDPQRLDLLSDFWGSMHVESFLLIVLG